MKHGDPFRENEKNVKFRFKAAIRSARRVHIWYTGISFTEDRRRRKRLFVDKSTSCEIVLQEVLSLIIMKP